MWLQRAQTNAVDSLDPLRGSAIRDAHQVSAEIVWAGAGTEHTVAGVAAGEPVVVAVATSDDRGHMSLFGPEAAR